MAVFAASITLLVASLISSQVAPAPKEASQFDFWLGNWKCTGEAVAADGTRSKTEAENEIKKILGGKVVEENFTMGSFVGRSHSVYDATAGLWRQTWVDNSGSYIALTGKFEDGTMTLTTIPSVATPKRVQRMVFSKISKESFEWDWETSTDNGETWSLSWHLRYTRAD